VAKNSDADDNYYNEILYLGNELMVGVTRANTAKIFSLYNGDGIVLAETSLPVVDVDHFYTVS
jgi:hypothetical protein